jgi:hypothetical protein
LNNHWEDPFGKQEGDTLSRPSKRVSPEVTKIQHQPEFFRCHTFSLPVKDYKRTKHHRQRCFQGLYREGGRFNPNASIYLLPENILLPEKQMNE